MIAAIDPGLNGAIALMYEDMSIYSIHDMPITKAGSKNIVDGEALTLLLRDVDKVIVEKVGASPQMGVSSAFNFGLGFGTVIGVAGGLGIPVETITPQKWKAMVGLKGSQKEPSRKRVIDLYPNEREFFERKKDADRAEAVLIGRAWLRIKAIKEKK